jgi:hypothetical protein
MFLNNNLPAHGGKNAEQGLVKIKDIDKCWLQPF